MCIRDRAVLGLAEDLVQHRDGNHAAVDQFAEHIPGAHTGELIGVAHENNTCLLYTSRCV